jgi:NAD+ synthase
MMNAQKVKDELVLWIRDYFDKNAKDCFAIIGISGGKDSSAIAALCVEALGVERGFGVLMPQGEQWDIDVSREVVKHLKIKHTVINIKSAVDSLFESIKAGGLEINKNAQINSPARIRMATLYAVAAIKGGLVVNTCNLSEDWVGYSTKYGDAAGDISPFARITASEVKAIGRELGLPDKFVEKVPQDGLSGLSDEENLGFSYAVLDKYIREGICEDKAVQEKIDRLHRINLHKITLMPCYELTN